MRIYEELFIVDPDASEEEIDSVVDQVEQVIKEAGGEIGKVEKWGKRKLAYHVKKREEGYYILIQFSSGAKTIKEIERRLRVHDQVLRYLTVRIDEKLKWLEKKKKAREKRAQRKPPPVAKTPSPPAETPKDPVTAVPGEPAPKQATEGGSE